MTIKKLAESSRFYQRYAKGKDVLYHATGKDKKDKLGRSVNIVGTMDFINKCLREG